MSSAHENPAPEHSVRVLLVENNEDDAALILRAIGNAGFVVTSQPVETAAEYQAALASETWDVVVSDYSLPQFDAISALRALHDRDLDLVFIVVSGTIDEESAVSILKAGAHDFVTKQNLARLGPAVRRELQDARDRAARREAQLALQAAQEALRASEAQLRQAQKMEAVGQLAGGIAHDFNNLLTAILGYTDLALGQVASDSEVAADLQKISKAGERARGLTAQLLAFSRKRLLQPRVVDLNTVVAEVEGMLRRVIVEDIRFEIAVEPGLEPVYADPGQLLQVLMNLAINARDAMPRGGVLRITTANVMAAIGEPGLHSRGNPQRCVVLTVSDTGCGMTAHVRARIFEPFFTTKSPGKGTGLGLSMVYGVVTESGGRISVESEPNRGTTFTIHLPVSEQVAAADTMAAADARPQTRGTETILLVEDEPSIRELVRKVLARDGYDVLEAMDVQHALEIAQCHPAQIHLLLSDIVMPELSGPDLAQRVVNYRRDVRVLYMSGFASRVERSVGLLSAGVSLLEKPFTPERLVASVRDSLTR
jgi:two-component system cell cycle sensor histidine kinase/response regulator CckA